MVGDNGYYLSLMEVTLLNCQFWLELLILMSLTFEVYIRLLVSLPTIHSQQPLVNQILRILMVIREFFFIVDIR